MERTLYTDNQGIKKQKTASGHFTSLHHVLLNKRQKRQFALVCIGFLVALFGLLQVTSQTLHEALSLESFGSGEVIMQVSESGKNLIVELAQWLIHYAL